MAQVKLNFSDLSKPQKLARAQAVIAASTGNANFPGTQPVLVALTASEYNAALRTAAVAALRQQLQTAEEAESAAYDEMTTNYGLWGNTVQALSGGSPEKITSAGYELKSTDRAPLVMTQPQDVNATSGDEPGEIDMTWEPVKGVRTYEVQYTTDLTGATGWTDGPQRGSIARIGDGADERDALCAASPRDRRKGHGAVEQCGAEDGAMMGGGSEF